MDGISLTRGFSVLDDVTARIFQPVLNHADKIIICATGNKFGKRAMAPLGPLTIATTVVTDVPVPSAYQEYFDTHGIRVLYPQN